MKSLENIKKVLFTFSFPLLFLLLNTTAVFGEPDGGMQTPIWTVDMPHRCESPATCETSSPAVADITGDGIVDVVVGTSNGHLVAVRHNGTLLWDRDTAVHFGMAANSQQINASPAVADIDNDGDMEIVVGTGTLFENICTQGGVIAYDHNGNFLWRFLTYDQYVPPTGCRDSVFSTPALGDLDNDGDLEIVFGGFDKRIYVLHHNGALDSPFPVDSHHIQRFPTWEVLQGRLADTIWGSASLADMDGDGYLDILISTDEGNFNDNFLPGEGWDCPYAMPPSWPSDYCGGALYMIDRFGNHLPGSPIRIHETMQSSPAVVDIDGNGTPEIFVGAGTFYYNFSPSHPTGGFRIYGWNNQGQDLPGWEGGKVTNGSTPASVAVGDIAGDGQAEVVALGIDKRLYAWFANGTTVPGFPMMPLHEGGLGNPYDVGYSPVLGDYDGDGKMEIFMRVGWGVTIVDGNGQQLTTTTNPPNAPMFYTYSRLDNNPALGDVDNDGKLELIAFNNTLRAWDLPNASGEADWPMFRFNPARTGHPVQPMLVTTPTAVWRLHEIDDGRNIQLSLQMQGVGGTIEWSAAGSSGITLWPDSGQLGSTPTTMMATVARTALTPGTNNKTVTITATIGGQPVGNSPMQIPVTIYLVEEVSAVYLPVITR